METLDSKQLEKLFNEIKYVELLVRELGDGIKDPYFANEAVILRNYRRFIDKYQKIINRLEEFKKDIFEIHDELINS